jgi:hypothetical protein
MTLARWRFGGEAELGDPHWTARTRRRMPPGLASLPYPHDVRRTVCGGAVGATFKDFPPSQVMPFLRRIFARITPPTTGRYGQFRRFFSGGLPVPLRPDALRRHERPSRARPFFSVLCLLFRPLPPFGQRSLSDPKQALKIGSIVSARKRHRLKAREARSFVREFVKRARTGKRDRGRPDDPDQGGPQRQRGRRAQHRERVSCAAGFSSSSAPNSSSGC